MAFDKARFRRHRRVRAKISGTAARPRLCVFRSHKGIYAQLIDDVSRRTLVSVSPHDLPVKKLMPKVEQARLLGSLLSEKALAQDITHVVFDRGGYQYHGRVKAFAEAARLAGLQF